MRFSTSTLGANYHFQPKSVVDPNHLGNVLTVVSDRKISVDNNADNVVDFFSPDIVSATDYGAFGNPLPGRSFNRNSYPAGMNGQLKDDEIFEGAYTAEFWEYDSRTGRRWETDPIVKPWESPYACFYNNPIVFSDYYGLDGDDNKPRPGADSKNKKREGAKSDWENADPKAEGSSGYDGTNDWKSKVDGDKIIVKFTPRSGGVDPSYYSFPSSENGSSDGDIAGDTDSRKTPAGSDPTPTAPVTTPTGTTPNPAPTGGGTRPRTTTPIGGATTPTPMVLQNICNPFAGSLSFNWQDFKSDPKDRNAAVRDIMKSCNGWLPCNTSAQITISSPWRRVLDGDPMSSQIRWGGRVPYMVMQDRSKWIQGIMIKYGKIPSGAFRVPIILFDQSGLQNGNINFR